MKILVRNKQTSEYIKETGIYTPVSVEAVDFLCPEQAVSNARRIRAVRYLKRHQFAIG